VVSYEHDSAGRTVGEPVVEVVVDTIVDIVVGAFAGTVADSAQLPAKLTRYSTSLTHPGVLSLLEQRVFLKITS